MNKWENSSTQSDGNKPSFKVNSNSNLVAWRIKPTLMPMFQDLARQAYEAHLINAPKLINLAKFSLSFFVEIWLQQKAAQARYERQQLQGQRAPVKDINGSLYTGSNRLNGG